MADINDIFHDEEDKLSDEELLKYLDGKATDEEMNAVERKMGEGSFENEAMEGLQQFGNKENLHDYVQQLNKNLHQQLAAKKMKKDKRKIKEVPLSIITVIIILLLCILGWLVIYLFQKTTILKPPAKQSSSINISSKQ